MNSPAAVLTLCLCSSLLSSALAPHRHEDKKSGCFKVNNCQCIMKDGSGLINLEAIGDGSGFLEHLRPISGPGTAEGDEVLLSFSPCRPFSLSEDLTESDCTDIAASIIIRYNTDGTHTGRCVAYGRHDGNQFHYNHSLKLLSVSYFAADEEQPLTVVHYHCNPNQSSSFTRDLRLGSDQVPLQMWVESPCACPNACSMGDLGLGTIFLIMLSLSAAAYFILGSCALRSFRGSSGVQIAPEPSVWCMVCSLCTERRPRRRNHTDSTRGEP